MLPNRLANKTKWQFPSLTTLLICLIMALLPFPPGVPGTRHRGRTALQQAWEVGCRQRDEALWRILAHRRSSSLSRGDSGSGWVAPLPLPKERPPLPSPPLPSPSSPSSPSSPLALHSAPAPPRASPRAPWRTKCPKPQSSSRTPKNTSSLTRRRRRR